MNPMNILDGGWVHFSLYVSEDGFPAHIVLEYKSEDAKWQVYSHVATTPDPKATEWLPPAGLWVKTYQCFSHVLCLRVLFVPLASIYKEKLADHTPWVYTTGHPERPDWPSSCTLQTMQAFTSGSRLVDPTAPRTQSKESSGERSAHGIV